MAGEDIKTLLLKFEATTELMRAELRKGERALSDIERKTSKTGNAISAGFARAEKAAAALRVSLGALGVAFGATALLSGSRAVLQFADDLQTAADRAGVSAEAYQRMREALRALELDTSQTNKVLESLVTILGSAQMGTLGKTEAAALERLGIAAKIANGEISTTDKFLDELGKAAGRYSSQAQFAADVSVIVGQRLGPKLAAALSDGGRAYQELAAAARVASDAQVEALARANEALDRLKERFRQTVVSVAGSVAIFFEQLGQAGFSFSKGTFADLDRFREIRREAELASRFSLKAFGFVPKPSPSSRPAPSPRPLPAVQSPGRQAAEQIDRAFQARAENFAEVAARLTEMARSSGKIKSDFSDLEPILKRSIPNLSKPFEDAARFADNLSRNLGQAIVNGQGIGRALVASFKAAAAEAIASGLYRLLIGTGEGGRPSGLIGTLFSRLGGLFGGFRADGGPVSAGRAYIVGERRPELFVPRTSGTILPGVGMAGGAGTVINVDARGAGDPRAVAEAVVLAVRASSKYTDARLNRFARSSLPRSMGA